MAKNSAKSGTNVAPIRPDSTLHLTESLVEKLGCHGKEVSYKHDQKILGCTLVLRIKRGANGLSKYFYLRKRGTRFSIGKYDPVTFPLSTAITKATVMASERFKNEDVFLRSIDPRDCPSLEKVAEEVFEFRKAHNPPKTLNQMIQRFNNHVPVWMKQLPINQLTGKLVRSFLMEKNYSPFSIKIVQIISAVWNFSKIKLDNEYLEGKENPCNGKIDIVHQPQESYVPTWDDILNLWEKLSELDPVWQGIIKTRILTGSHLEEIYGFEWDMLTTDSYGHWLVMPRGFHKIKKKHFVYLDPNVYKLITNFNNTKDIKKGLIWRWWSNNKVEASAMGKQWRKLDTGFEIGKIRHFVINECLLHDINPDWLTAHIYSKMKITDTYADYERLKPKFKEASEKWHKLVAKKVAERNLRFY